MANEGSRQRELQEKSIKARKNELFVGEAVDPLAPPRKTFRQVLKETPATPMTKNVKLILLGSSAPVLLLFVAALHAAGNTSRAKAPEVPLISDKPAPVKKIELVKLTGNQPSTPAAEAKTDEPKPEAPKPPAKKKKTTKKKPKPKDNPPVVAENTEGAKQPDEAKPDEAKPDEARNTPKTASTGGSKPKPGASNADSKGKSSSSAPAVPLPPKRTTSVFKKPPKPPNPVYPKRGSEKKDDKASPDKAGSSAGNDLGLP